MEAQTDMTVTTSATDNDESLVVQARTPEEGEVVNIPHVFIEPSDDITEDENGLNQRQEFFCQLYATETEFFGNGVQSYIEAYAPDQTRPNWYKTACVRASQLLSNVKVINRINAILEETGLNDAHIDKQLSFLISQHADFTNKLGAIKEYNKLKSRIVTKLDHTTNGKDLPTPILGNVLKNDSDNQSIETQEEN